ncbi:MAG: methyltransferase domain-containing protein [Candidatus Lokiarchaeota archaeon]|nr:methyltransferase domain-containing protein [Candidatus Lokiarchaeota archaeon]
MADILFLVRNIFIIILIIFLFLMLWIFVIVRILRKFHKFPIPAFATRLIDNAWRRKFIQKPKLIAERMDLKPGMIVLEIGPGKGSYTKAVAEKVLPNGKVYAIDIQEAVINRLQKRVENEQITNIIPKIDDAYNLSFEDDSIDRIFLITCLPEIPEPVKALKDFKRVLKIGGILSLSELLLDPDYPLRKTEKRWAKEAGLEFLEGFGNFFVYQLNFIKK